MLPRYPGPGGAFHRVRHLCPFHGILPYARRHPVPPEGNGRADRRGHAHTADHGMPRRYSLRADRGRRARPRRDREKISRRGNPGLCVRGKARLPVRRHASFHGMDPRLFPEAGLSRPHRDDALPLGLERARHLYAPAQEPRRLQPVQTR